MSKIPIDLPATFNFSTEIPVRITDLNYGGHVGNDTILSILHEVRIQFLNTFGYSETDLAGAGTIMGNVVINFKAESFYGDVIVAAVAVNNISGASFDVVYQLRKKSDNKIVAEAKTGMVCFDYNRRRVIPMPEEARMKLAE